MGCSWTPWYLTLPITIKFYLIRKGRNDVNCLSCVSWQCEINNIKFNDRKISIFHVPIEFITLVCGRNLAAQGTIHHIANCNVQRDQGNPSQTRRIYIIYVWGWWKPLCPNPKSNGPKLPSRLISENFILVNNLSFCHINSCARQY